MKRSAVRFHVDARAEVIQAQSWYSERSEAAGAAFLLEVEHAPDEMDEIAENPERWPQHLHGTRRFVFHKFPYLVVYRRRGRGIQVVAVAHGKRRPG